MSIKDQQLSVSRPVFFMTLLETGPYLYFENSNWKIMVWISEISSASRGPPSTPDGLNSMAKLPDGQIPNIGLSLLWTLSPTFQTMDKPLLCAVNAHSHWGTTKSCHTGVVYFRQLNTVYWTIIIAEDRTPVLFAINKFAEITSLTLY